LAVIETPDTGERSDRREQFQNTFERVKQSAEAGEAGAQFQLAKIFMAGVAGVRDGRQAREWMQRSAEQGHTEAQFGLGVMSDAVPAVRHATRVRRFRGISVPPRRAMKVRARVLRV
jgi:TPR repeat protein